MYYRGAQAALVVYDITNDVRHATRTTFLSRQRWSWLFVLLLLLLLVFCYCYLLLLLSVQRLTSLANRFAELVEPSQGVGEGAADTGRAEDGDRVGGQQERPRVAAQDQDGGRAELRRGQRHPLHGDVGQDLPERQGDLRSHRQDSPQGP